ncbi:hypothetical protein CLOP_g7463 [Closterium sp. NIES-67]|nr:hypothetical protein CLOP_g7463 [Closterium sp. NIES-67]
MREEEMLMEEELYLRRQVKGANGELVGLGNVLLVEGLCANLLSVRRLQKSKAEVTFGPTSCRAKLGKKHYRTSQDPTCTCAHGCGGAHKSPFPLRQPLFLDNCG